VSLYERTTSTGNTSRADHPAPKFCPNGTMAEYEEMVVRTYVEDGSDTLNLTFHRRNWDLKA
jgi:hypothetical protein